MITEEQVMKWMRGRVQSGEFENAAALAKEFLDQHDIHNVLDPEFQMVIDAGFKLAGEIAEIQL